MQARLPQSKPFLRSRVFGLCLLFCAELLVLAVLYEFFAQIECYRLDAAEFCTFLRSLVGRAISIFAVSTLLVWAWPGGFATFVAESERAGGRRASRTAHFAGLGMLIFPLVLFWGDDLGAQFRVAAVFWGAGAVLAGLGGLLWIAPWRAWRGFLAQDGFAVIPALALGAILPDLAEALRPLWDWSALAGLTFLAVAQLLTMLGWEVYTDPSYYEIGVNSASGGFVVQVGQPCSGVEGFALVTVFVLIYGYIFRKDLRLLRFLLVVLPLGLLLSWMLNVVRIAALILIGAHVSPELAVNGFHSYAGWLFFTLLALGLVGAVQKTDWLHKDGIARGNTPALRTDDIAAKILPFVAFMLVSTLLSATLLQPELGYPFKVAVMACALLYFRPALSHLAWNFDVVSLGVGLMVGIGWVATAGDPDPTLANALAGLSHAAMVGWLVLRLVGTVILVPTIEEMFFRGYVLARLDGQAVWQRAGAILISSVGFAVLHGRSTEAGLAGLLFCAVYLRRGRVTDAIIAHATANLIVAAAALLRGDYSLI